MSVATTTSSASLNKASRTRRIPLATTVTLLVGLSAGAVFAQTASEPQIQSAPQAETVQPAQPSPQTPAAPDAPVVQPNQPSMPAQERPAAVAPAQPQGNEAAPAERAQSSVAPALTPEGAAPTNEVSTPVEPVGVDPASAEHRADIPHNLSPWGMFMAADWVVKGVMIGLAFASLVTWTVWVAKSVELAGARVRAGATLKVIRKAKTLNEATEAVEKKGGPAALMLRMATHEMQLSDAVVEHTDGGGIKERVSSALSRIETHAGRRMSRGTGVLATIGSTAPFVGLFGTVWGIMNSFISISESQTTNLAVVAPGIAEALLATAIGLVAAIPAVVIYNVFARSITGYRHLLADAAAGVERLVSRDLDFRRIPPGSTSKPAVSLVGR